MQLLFRDPSCSLVVGVLHLRPPAPLPPIERRWLRHDALPPFKASLASSPASVVAMQYLKLVQAWSPRNSTHGVSRVFQPLLDTFSSHSMLCHHHPWPRPPSDGRTVLPAAAAATPASSSHVCRSVGTRSNSTIHSTSTRMSSPVTMFSTAAQLSGQVGVGFSLLRCGFTRLAHHWSRPLFHGDLLVHLLISVFQPRFHPGSTRSVVCQPIAPHAFVASCSSRVAFTTSCRAPVSLGEILQRWCLQHLSEPVLSTNWLCFRQNPNQAPQY